MENLKPHSKSGRRTGVWANTAGGLSLPWSAGEILCASTPLLDSHAVSKRLISEFGPVSMLVTES